MNEIVLKPQEKGTGLALVSDIKTTIAQVKAVQEIMKAVMIDGTHYGVIPGCKLPSLYKAGSEVLLSAFKIAVEPVVREIRDGDHITYQIACTGRHMQSSIAIGTGVGEASTAEDKYCWRAAVCDEEYDETPEDKRRVKWSKGYQGKPATSSKQVRTNPADIANTVLKIAKKRAQIDLCLTGLAASDIFTQDVEDLPEGYVQGDTPPTKSNNKYQPKEKTEQSTATGSVTEGQVRLIRAKLAAAQKPEADLLALYSAENIESLPKAEVNKILDWIAGKDGAQ